MHVYSSEPVESIISYYIMYRNLLLVCFHVPCGDIRAFPGVLPPKFVFSLYRENSQKAQIFCAKYRRMIVQVFPQKFSFTDTWYLITCDAALPNFIYLKFADLFLYPTYILCTVHYIRGHPHTCTMQLAVMAVFSQVLHCLILLVLSKYKHSTHPTEATIAWAV